MSAYRGKEHDRAREYLLEHPEVLELGSVELWRLLVNKGYRLELRDVLNLLYRTE